ncbi:MAG: 5-bromo-4-chloroindolyl phosphate hydrolysis family protein [Candidatus Weimeria sp.]
MGIGDNLKQAGNDLMNSVNRAVSSGDFSHLSSDINWQLRELQRQMMDSAVQTGQNIFRGKQGQNESYSNGTQTFTQNNSSAQGNPYNRTYGSPAEKEHQTDFTNPVKNGRGSKDANVIEIIFLVIFTVIFILSLAGGLLNKIFGLFVLGTVCLIADVILFILHSRTRKALKSYSDFEKYRVIIGNDEYETIDELALRTREQKDQIISELKGLKKAGYLPKAVLDDKETVVVLSDYAYRYYMDYEKQQQKAEASEAADMKLPEEARAVIAQGEKYIADFHHLNDIIPDEGLSEKLDRLEKIIKKIFEEVRRRPQKASDLHRLLDYYLPTTKKLVQAYADSENNPDTENISQIKSEIESSLDMINSACEKIFDQMFSEDAMDISSDINVMKQMMEQDGLVNDQKKG